MSANGFADVLLGERSASKRRREDEAAFPPPIRASTSCWVNETGTAFFSCLPDIHLLHSSIFHTHIHVTVGLFCACPKDCKIRTGVVMVVLELSPCAIDPSVNVRLLFVRPQRVYFFTSYPCHSLYLSLGMTKASLGGSRSASPRRHRSHPPLGEVPEEGSFPGFSLVPDQPQSKTSAD